jgi:O-acetyl-ADP-ribose deacetylase (regulator of RNase III)/uncharacterized protein YwgA
MISLVKGNMFDSHVQTLVNTVNCVGIMGKGLALQFKKLFPDMYSDYQRRCTNKELKPGEPYIYKGLIPPYVINFPTKDHWRSVSRLQDIVNGMEYLLQHYKEWGVTSIAMPALGCGNGQLEWRTVGPLLYYYLQQMDIDVELYAPDQSLSLDDLKRLAAGITEDKKKVSSQPNSRPQLAVGWIMLVEILYRLEQEPYHYPVGRTMFQKITFAATREGIPTGLNFEKNSYGPFSQDLKEVETVLVNCKLLKEKPIGKMFNIEVGPAYAGIREKFLPRYEKCNDTLNKIVDLFMRVDTGQAEITATILFSVDQLKKETEFPHELDVLKEVMAWKQRRRPPLKEDEVALSIRNLAALNWVQLTPSNDLPINHEFFV